jgi:hypothetical protein
MSVAPVETPSDTRAVNTPDPAMAVPGNISAPSGSQASNGSTTASQGMPVTGVCAVVRIQIDQQAVITRNAFVGTLEIDNGGAAISNLRVTIDFTTSTGMSMGMNMGNMGANDDFAYAAPLQTNVGGSVQNGTGTIAPVAADGTSTAGVIQYTFIPTEMAAMNGVTSYNVGGSFSYTQDGQQLTVPILPATIEVLPDPQLVLNYFLQRDVIGDDPFTPQIEPSEPFYLGLQVTNVGKGQANNFTITTAQPQIVDNEKGLLINFQITGTQVGGQQATPSLTANLGTIAAGATQTAEFIMLSSLQGRFINFSASFQHVDALGNKDTSLIKSVNTHIMIHVAEAGYVGNPSNAPVQDDGVPDFLTMEIPNKQVLPDTLWLSNGSEVPVSQATQVNVTPDTQPLTYDLSATDAVGWNYLQVEDPTAGQYRLSQVLRSDGLKIIVGATNSNAWTTDRTFSATDSSFTRDNVFHLLDYAGTAGAYSYKLIYTKLDTTQPTILSVTPIEPATRSIPVQSVTVTFSKAISSFPLGALTLKLNGGSNLIPGSGVTITATDSSNTTFTINGLASLTTAAGSYVLLIDPTQAEDTSANFGAGASVELDFVVDTTHAVATITQVSPSNRNTAVDTVTVSFSKPINPASFTTAALSLTLNGSSTNLITSAVTVTENGTSGTSFTIAGLGSLTTANGTYTLKVDSTQVTDTSSNPGVGADMTTWIMDTVIPTITSLQQPQSPRNIVVPNLTVTFSEPINPSTFTTAALTLTRTDSNGTSANLINEFTDAQRAVTISPVAGTTSTWQIANINWPQGLQGTYTLTVNGSTIQDPAGNTVSGSASSTWILNTTTPPAPTDLAITPNNGIRPGLTNTEVLTLSGYTPQPNMRVEMFDVTESDNFGVVYSAATSSTEPDGSTGYFWSKSLTFDAPGDHNMRTLDIDSAQNVSADSFFDIFVDLTLPTVASMGTIATPTVTPVASEAVTFSKAINPATFSYHALTLTVNGGTTNLITSSVTLTPTDSTDKTFTIGGLGSLDAAAGTYTLTVDPTQVQDDAGNFGIVPAGSTSNVVSWVENPNGTSGTPPTSSITPFPGEVLPAAGTVHATSFTVSWSGHDAMGSTMVSFNIYVSDNGGPFTLWQSHTMNTSATYTGVEQHTYGFISQAIDDMGTTETLRTTADASVFVSIQGSIHGKVFEDANETHTDTASTSAGLQGWTVFLDLNNDGTLDSGDPSTTTATDGTFSFTGLEPGTYEVAEVVKPGWIMTYPNAGGSSVREMSVTVGAANAPVYLADFQPDGKSASGTASSTAANQALIGLTQFQSDPRFAGITGQGETVAVLDSGIDGTSPAFGPIGPSGLAEGIAYEYNFINNTSQANDVLGHGSVVSSIIGSRDATNPGIAPGVQLIDLKVLNDSGEGDFGTVGRALQWVADNAARYNIVSVNMSFGDSGAYNQPISLYGLGPILAELAQDNVIVVSAAGNNYYQNGSRQGVSYPAADPNSLGVGAVWGSNLGGPFAWSTGAVDYTTSPNQIMSFSQRSATLSDTMAPGAFIQGVGADGTVSTLSGTSMASPMVAGVAALADDLALETLGRRLTPAEFRYLLTSTGPAILDSAQGQDNVNHSDLLYHGINVEALAEGILGLENGTVPDVTTGPVHESTSGSGAAVAASSPPGDQSATFTAGGSVSGIDFGNFKPGTVSGTVYLDANGDGSLDNGESGQSGWVVTLHANSGGAPDQTFTTSASGTFSFTNLAAGSYTLTETMQSGFQQTQPGSANNFKYTFTVVSEFAATDNFGNVVFAAPANLAISPDTGSSSTDGVTDTGSVNFQGTVNQTGLSVHLKDLTTNTDLGAHTVTGTSFSIPLTLAEGTHVIQAQASDSAGESSQTSSFTVLVDLTPPTSHVATLPAQETSTTFGVNWSGSDNTGGSGLAYFDIYVSIDGGAFTLWQSHTTAATANYTGQQGHSYGFFSIATDNAGNHEPMKTTADATTAVPSSIVSGTVYLDANGDGSLDNGESGQSGWVVTLHATSGGAADQTFTTGTSGTFSFTNMAAGSYTLSETMQSGYQQTQPGAANNFKYTFTVTTGFSATADNFGNKVFTAPTNLGISPDTGISFTDGITDTGSVNFTGTVNQTGLSVHLQDLTTSTDLGSHTVTGTTFSIPLTLAEGTHVIQAQASDSAGESSQTSSFTVRVDKTLPTSHVNTLPGQQTSDTFTVPVTFSDPTGTNNAPASGVASVDLYVSTDGVAFSLYQSMSANGATSPLNFTFTGNDRTTYYFHSVAHDVAGNTEIVAATAIQASTFVPDLNPPVTHVLQPSTSNAWSPFPSSLFSSMTASSYQSGVFTLNWAGADPDQPVGGSIASLSVYVQVDGGSPSLVGTVTPSSPTAVTSGGTTYYVYSGTLTYHAQGDGNSHTYKFYSIGTDDQHLAQPTPGAADVTFTETYTAPLTASLTVEKGIQERSFIRYLDVNFNQSLATSAALQSLQSGLHGSSPSAFVQLLWYGENLTSSSTSQASVNLFGTGTTAVLTFSGSTLSIDFGGNNPNYNYSNPSGAVPNGITNLLTVNGVTGSRTTATGDGWYALGIDPYGNPSQGTVFWLTFFRLLGDANGNGVVNGPTSTAGTDEYIVNAARGQTGALLNGDVNGDGSVNTTDLQETIVAANAQHAVGTTAPQTFPQFQIFAGQAGAGNVVPLTQAQVQALVPQAIAAWQAAGLNATGMQLLQKVDVEVADLGVNILGLEDPGLIRINETAVGHGWYVGGSQAFGAADTRGQQLAGADSPAVNQVDLLTVLEHELGHVIGLGDNGVSGNLLDTTLGLGARRAPTAADVAALAPAFRTADPAAAPALMADAMTASGPANGLLLGAGNVPLSGLLAAGASPVGPTELGGNLIGDGSRSASTLVPASLVPLPSTASSTPLNGPAIVVDGQAAGSLLFSVAHEASNLEHQGGGGMVLVGGEGADILVGGQGQALLLGGIGDDDLQAQGNDFHLQVGTQADATHLALQSVVAEWASGAGTSFTVQEDSSAWTGAGAGHDWFFGDTSN